MCCSRLSFVLRPPWTPERPRYPIRLKVRLMDCPGRGEEGSDVLWILARRLVREPRTVLWVALARFFTHPARPKSPAQRFIESLYSLLEHPEHLKLNRGAL